MTAASKVTIRTAQEADVEAIAEIYNQAIVSSAATFDSEPKSVDQQRAWFRAHDAKHPILVAEIDGDDVGWSALSAWSDRPASAETAESSTCIREDSHGQGIGRQLKEAMLEEGRRVGLHTIIAHFRRRRGQPALERVARIPAHRRDERGWQEVRPSARCLPDAKDLSVEREQRVSHFAKPLLSTAAAFR